MSLLVREAKAADYLDMQSPAATAGVADSGDNLHSFMLRRALALVGFGDDCGATGGWSRTMQAAAISAYRL